MRAPRLIGASTETRGQAPEVVEGRGLLEPTQKALEKVEELGQQLSKASLTKAEALRDLASVTEKLEQQNRELGKDPALKQIEKAARAAAADGHPTPEALQKRIEEMQKSLGEAANHPESLDKLQRDLQKAQQMAAGMKNANDPAAQAAREQLSQSLSAMAQQAQALGLSSSSLEQALKALEQGRVDQALQGMQAAMNDLAKARDMARALEQMQQQAARSGKDLPEQLAFGQAEYAGTTAKNDRRVEEREIECRGVGQINGGGPTLRGARQRVRQDERVFEGRGQANGAGPASRRFKGSGQSCG